MHPTGQNAKFLTFYLLNCFKGVGFELSPPMAALKLNLTVQIQHYKNSSTKMSTTQTNALDIVEERAAQYGTGILSDQELLESFLLAPTATQLLQAAGGLQGLRRWSLDELRASAKLTRLGALKVAAILELAKRFSREPLEQNACFDTPEAIARHFAPEAASLSVEKFWAVCLDRKNRMIRKVEATSGTATNCLCHAREVFRTAIHVSATAVIAVHNHPSGDPAPSRADIQVTRQLREAAKVVGIELIDHIIIGQKSKDPNYLGYYSFNDAGLV